MRRALKTIAVAAALIGAASLRLGERRGVAGRDVPAAC